MTIENRGYLVVSKCGRMVGKSFGNKRICMTHESIEQPLLICSTRGRASKLLKSQGFFLSTEVKNYLMNDAKMIAHLSRKERDTPVWEDLKDLDLMEIKEFVGFYEERR
jgi:hypothetical protein